MLYLRPGWSDLRRADRGAKEQPDCSAWSYKPQSQLQKLLRQALVPPPLVALDSTNGLWCRAWAGDQGIFKETPQCGCRRR
jgi:hypothetical protein